MESIGSVLSIALSSQAFTIDSTTPSLFLMQWNLFLVCQANDIDDFIFMLASRKLINNRRKKFLTYLFINHGTSNFQCLTRICLEMEIDHSFETKFLKEHWQFAVVAFRLCLGNSSRTFFDGFLLWIPASRLRIDRWPMLPMRVRIDSVRRVHIDRFIDKLTWKCLAALWNAHAKDHYRFFSQFHITTLGHVEYPFDEILSSHFIPISAECRHLFLKLVIVSLIVVMIKSIEKKNSFHSASDGVDRSNTVDNV